MGPNSAYRTAAPSLMGAACGGGKRVFSMNSMFERVIVAVTIAFLGCVTATLCYMML